MTGIRSWIDAILALAAVGYNGAGINGFLLEFPMLPKPCKSEQGTLRLMNMVGLFAGFRCLPFKKSGRRNQAASMLVGVSK